MNLIAITILVVYAIAILFIFSYSIAQLTLVISYLKQKSSSKKEKKISELIDDDELPLVTIQLPIYNEMYVAERLLNSVASLDYPNEKLEIQVLDDSTDETVDIIDRKVQRLFSEGKNIFHVRRATREGFKAGALAYGLKSAKGEFIAIFDADFLPEKDFLKKTIPAFKDEKVGVVQTRWGHVNEKYSLLTRLQAFGLNAHFTVEQTGRNAAGYFINFNGTAGIWRKICITDSGGWESDTLTEDLDLSYRAQLHGWEFVFMEEVSTPAELPVTMSALKNQQYRWNKGAAECAKKNLPRVLKQSRLGFAKKFHAAFHLMNSTIFIAIIITSLLSIPLLIIKNEFRNFHWVFTIVSFFLAAFAILGIFYLTASVQYDKKFARNVWQFIISFPLFLSMSMGLALHNAVAVIEGYAGRKTSFIRTPKFNIVSPNDKWNQNRYLVKSVSWVTIAEGFMSLYFIYGIFLGIQLRDYGLIPFHFLLAIGFGSVFCYSVSHSLRTIRIGNKRASVTRRLIWSLR